MHLLLKIGFHYSMKINPSTGGYFGIVNKKLKIEILTEWNVLTTDIC